MKYPIDHHFIPAFFLQQWTGSNNKLVEYTIRFGKLIAKPVGPRSTGYEPGLYSFPELPPDAAQYLEQVFFDYADRMAAGALQSQLAGQPKPQSAELVSAWSRFVVALHLRHPDAMPELRAAARSIWDGSGKSFQTDYEAVKKPEDPPTFDGYLATKDPLTSTKVQINMIIKVFDNERLGKHVNNMEWSVIDVSPTQHRFILSDRPVVFANLSSNVDGVVYLPISPTKMFVAANSPNRIRALRSLSARELVHNSNRFLVGRARKFAWTHDDSQTAFIEKHMSTRIEPTPLFPGIGRDSTE
jgi:hypothetical protein